MDTGIPVSAWWAEDEATLATALELRREAAAEERRQNRRTEGPEGVVMGG